MHTIHSAFYDLLQSIKSLYDEREASAIAHEVMEHITGKSKLQRITDKDAPLNNIQEAQLTDIKAKLKAGKPMQYALGEAWFMGRKFIVNEHVLIPRPETEELVQWVIDDYKEQAIDKSALDIGTGSGCIPISLKLTLPELDITSCDISQDALNVAQSNAKNLGVNVNFIELDFLSEDARHQLPKFDIIVSNPPYIPISEKESLDIHVRDHEPSLALFVPNDDALLFYRIIAQFGLTNLNAHGTIYCETHVDYAQATQQLFIDLGYKNVELRKDLHGNNRMIKAQL
jgi:release factor glutamine methyltransferase